MLSRFGLALLNCDRVYHQRLGKPLTMFILWQLKVWVCLSLIMLSIELILNIEKMYTSDIIESIMPEVSIFSVIIDWPDDMHYTGKPRSY